MRAFKSRRNIVLLASLSGLFLFPLTAAAMGNGTPGYDAYMKNHSGENLKVVKADTSNFRDAERRLDELHGRKPASDQDSPKKHPKKHHRKHLKHKKKAARKAVPSRASEVAAAPAPAPSAAPAPAAPERVLADAAPNDNSVDLTLAELKALAIDNDFESVYQGADPDSRVVLTGMVPTSCIGEGKIQFLTSNSDAILKANGKLGFRVTDPTHAGRDCVANFKKTHTSCDSVNCSPLSNFAKLDLSAAGDGSVQVCHRELGDPYAIAHKPLVCEDFDTPLTHVSRATITAKRRADIQEAQRRRVAQFENQLANCYKSDGDLQRASDARDSLISLGRDMDQINRKFNEDQLRHWEYQADTADLTDLKPLAEDVRAFAKGDGRDYAERAAGILHKIALRYTRKENATGEDFKSAETLIAQAQDLPISDSSKKIFASYRVQIRTEKVANDLGKLEQSAQDSIMSGGGIGGSPMFMASYMKIMQETQKVSMEACYGKYRSLESCSQMSMVAQNARSLPQKTQQMQNQYNRWMNSFMGNNNGFGNPQGQPNGQPNNRPAPGAPGFSNWNQPNGGVPGFSNMPAPGYSNWNSGWNPNFGFNNSNPGIGYSAPFGMPPNTFASR